MICPSCHREFAILVEGTDLCIGCDALLPDWPTTDTRAGLRRLRIWIDEQIGARIQADVGADLRAGHAAFRRGDRSEWAVACERTYQRTAKQRQRAARRAS